MSWIINEGHFDIKTIKNKAYIRLFDDIHSFNMMDFMGKRNDNFWTIS